MDLLLIIIIAVILFGGVGAGWRGYSSGNPGYSILGVILIILVLVLLFGHGRLGL